MIGVTVLGATGSIGKSTLDVLARHPDRFRAVALTANRDVEGLAAQCRALRPAYAVMADPDAAATLRHRLAALGLPTTVLAGPDGLRAVCELPDVGYVMAAIVGAAGLLPTLAAARAGKRVLLANKEALVMAGPLFMAAVRAGGAEVLPIDSEHNAVFQCLPARFGDGLAAVGVRRILLTASGGPFRSTPRAELRDVTPEQACAHPNWSMGRKISVDSATMMNKGLEVIEAHWLFGADPDRIDVVLHPQSVVHSLVEYADGSSWRSWAIRTCARRSPTPSAGRGAWNPASPASTWPGWGGWTSRRRTWNAFPASGWPTRPCGRVERRRPYSTLPTRSRSRPSSTGGCRSPASRR